MRADSKRTIANLSDWPHHRIVALAALLKGQSVVGNIECAFDIIRSRPHGHVAAVLGTLSQLKLDRLISRTRCRERDLSVAMIASRLIAPASKLAITRSLSSETTDSTLGEQLGVENAGEDECYAAMDWLFQRQVAVEDALAKRHLADGCLVLYDVTSTYFEGHTCPLAKFGHSRDGKKDKLQIVVGLLTNGEGCPVAVEVFEGNTGDPTTLAPQVAKLKSRFERVGVTSAIPAGAAMRLDTCRELSDNGDSVHYRPLNPAAAEGQVAGAEAPAHAKALDVRSTIPTFRAAYSNDGENRAKPWSPASGSIRKMAAEVLLSSVRPTISIGPTRPWAWSRRSSSPRGVLG